ncbi:SpoIID/LytB domain-containing protein [filamentous cyanobacterium LEGE 11480]|uniref:SpoIID/LytB domain-containing protein n=1 Tax=Romeriopsis navalis LEGE 11480 TaxID=2777977 RepID=A0A928VRT4_9CYAN|nr:SpoIID/LytB domain-containing protein [Romeriopsis navalis]MBE9032603.1 SpoIID/LytB domain-containing protein [Romeriopsis navalis LEGE 11480]
MVLVSRVSVYRAWFGAVRSVRRPVKSAVLAVGSGLAVTVAAIASTVLFSSPVRAQARDIQLQIGIVQRFGDKAKDTMTLTPLPGDQLTVRLAKGDGSTQTLRVNQLKLETNMLPLSKPRLEQKVIFSEHRSFETAEEVAQQWRSRGVKVEIAQPNRWQVWADRQVYKSPAVLGLLVQNLQRQGVKVRLESKNVTKIPVPSFVAGGFRYNRDRLEISAGRGVIMVDRAKDNAPKRRYPGSLKLQPNAYGTTTLVNLVPLETYLRGVVPYEIGRNAPFQSMAAQAVLARTYVLRNTRRFAIDNYQLCATTQCQVYFGLNGTTKATDRAISLTRGQVLTYNNELVDALYSSTTGGVTAAFTDVWRGNPRPYLRAKVDAVGGIWNLQQRPLTNEQNLRTFISQKKGFNESEISNWFRWSKKASLNKMGSDLRKYLKSIEHPFAGFQAITNVQVMERSSGGRVFRLGIVTDLGAIELERDEILLAFDAPNSLLFYMDPITDAKTQGLTGFKFTGGGLGHAVGLSQYGSYHLGKLGWNYDRILSFYFPGARLQGINSSITAYREVLPPAR